MIAQSQSGTGKTATFLLAMLSRISTDVHYCQCLCMAPTRELALQIESVGRQMAQFMTEVSFATAVRSPRGIMDFMNYFVFCPYYQNINLYLLHEIFKNSYLLSDVNGGFGKVFVVIYFKLVQYRNFVY